MNRISLLAASLVILGAVGFGLAGIAAADVAPPEDPEDIEIEDPENETVVVDVEFLNDTTATVNLSDNGEVVDSEQLDGNESTETATLNATEAGNHSVTVETEDRDDLGDITIDVVDDSTPAFGGMGGMAAGLGGLVVLGAAVYLIGRNQ